MQYKKSKGIYRPDITPDCVLAIDLNDGYMSESGDPVVRKVFDHSQYHNHGTVEGAVPRYQGFLFDGIDDYILIPDFIGGLSAISIFVWMERTLNEFDFPFGYYRTSWLGDTITGIYTYDSPKKIRFGIVTIEEEVKNIEEIYSIDGKWFFIAGVWDGSYLYLYINGVSIATPVAVEGTGIFSGGSSAGTYIGSYPSVLLYHAGLVGEVKVYNRALTALEIKNHYELTRWRYSK